MAQAFGYLPPISRQTDSHHLNFRSSLLQLLWVTGDGRSLASPSNEQKQQPMAGCAALTAALDINLYLVVCVAQEQIMCQLWALFSLFLKVTIVTETSLKLAMRFSSLLAQLSLCKLGNWSSSFLFCIDKEFGETNCEALLVLIYSTVCYLTKYPSMTLLDKLAVNTLFDVVCFIYLIVFVRQIID